MAGMLLEVEHKPVEERDERSPTGTVQVEFGEGRGVLLTPIEIDPDRSYPLITVFHGAGRHDEMLIKGCEPEAEKRQALFFVPRSVEPTWDLIVSGEGGADVDVHGGRANHVGNQVTILVVHRLVFVEQARL